jgi:hypothetical protein
MVGAFAFLWMLAASHFELLSWVAFLTWGAFFLAGVNTQNILREAIGFTLGILFAWAIVLIGTELTSSLGTYAFPTAVAIAAFVIVILELIPWFDMAPSYFLGAAAFFAAGATTDSETFMSVFVPGMLGLGIGVATGYIRKLILPEESKKQPRKV